VPFRFVHAADIHLDSPLRSLALRDAALAELIGNATRHAFTAIIDLCLDEQVDALLLAGDLYDGEQTSMKTALFLAEQLRPLHQAGIAVFIIRGNHDALSKITQELTFPDGTVTVFKGRADAKPVLRGPGALPVVIHGLSFQDQHAPDSLLPRYQPPVEGAVNIGLMHTSLDGSTGHSRYAPCRLAALLSSGFNYWALGHIHKRAEYGDARSKVVMPGIPQGRDINEAGSKSVSLVTISDDFSVQVVERRTSVAQFERVTVDVAGITEWRALVQTIGRALAQCRTATASDQLIARLQLAGSTPLAWQMRRDRDLLQTEAMDQAAQIGRCSIEQVELACRPPREPVAAGSGVPVAELGQLIGDDILASESYRLELDELVAKLSAKLPPDIRRSLWGEAPPTPHWLADIAAEGVEDVLARLQPLTAAGDI
jgi:exonuclease SbcD